MPALSPPSDHSAERGSLLYLRRSILCVSVAGVYYVGANLPPQDDHGFSLSLRMISLAESQNIHW